MPRMNPRVVVAWQGHVLGYWGELDAPKRSLAALAHASSNPGPQPPTCAWYEYSLSSSEMSCAKRCASTAAPGER